MGKRSWKILGLGSILIMGCCLGTVPVALRVREGIRIEAYNRALIHAAYTSGNKDGELDPKEKEAWHEARGWSDKPTLEQINDYIAECGRRER